MHINNTKISPFEISTTLLYECPVCGLWMSRSNMTFKKCQADDEMEVGICKGHKDVEGFTDKEGNKWIKCVDSDTYILKNKSKRND